MPKKITELTQDRIDFIRTNIISIRDNAKSIDEIRNGLKKMAFNLDISGREIVKAIGVNIGQDRKRYTEWTNGKNSNVIYGAIMALGKNCNKEQR